MKVYVGFKEKEKPVVFEAEAAPTKQTHPQFSFVYGPFASVEAARKYVDAMGELACGEG